MSKKRGGREGEHISVSISAAPRDVTDADQWNGSMRGRRRSLSTHGCATSPVGRALHGNPAVLYTYPLATLRGGNSPFKILFIVVLVVVVQPGKLFFILFFKYVNRYIAP